MGLVMGSRSYGMLLAPAIGGFLAEPIQQYTPLRNWLARHESLSWVSMILIEYPFLLPNVVVAIICLISAIAVTYFVEETLVCDKRRHPKWMLLDFYNSIISTLKGYHDRFTTTSGPTGGTDDEKKDVTTH